MMYVNTLGKTQGEQKLYEDKEKVLEFFELCGYEVVSILHRNSSITYEIKVGDTIKSFMDYADAGYPLMYRLSMFVVNM